MKPSIDPRPDHEAPAKMEVAEAPPVDNRRQFRVRTAIRAGAGMVCPTGEC